METTQSKMTLEEKINKIQSNLKVKAEKSGNNSYANYSYAKESDVLGALKPLLAEYKIAYTQSLVGDYSLTEIRGEKSINWLFQCKGEFVIRDIESKETIRIETAYIGKNSDPDKAQGSAMTYHTKFWLKKIFGLPDDDLDPDSQEPTKNEKKNYNNNNYNNKNNNDYQPKKQSEKELKIDISRQIINKANKNEELRESLKSRGLNTHLKLLELSLEDLQFLNK